MPRGRGFFWRASVFVFVFVFVWLLIQIRIGSSIHVVFYKYKDKVSMGIYSCHGMTA